MYTRRPPAAGSRTYPGLPEVSGVRRFEGALDGMTMMIIIIIIIIIIIVIIVINIMDDNNNNNNNDDYC